MCDIPVIPSTMKEPLQYEDGTITITAKNVVMDDFPSTAEPTPDKKCTFEVNGTGLQINASVKLANGNLACGTPKPSTAESGCSCTGSKYFQYDAASDTLYIRGKVTLDSVSGMKCSDDEEYDRESCACKKKTNSQFCDWGKKCGSYYVVDGTKHAVRVPDTSSGTAACDNIARACYPFPYDSVCQNAYDVARIAGEAYWHDDYPGPATDSSCF